MSNLTVNDFTAGDVITASAMNTNFATIENYVNTSPGLAKLTGATFTGLLTANAGVTVSGTTTTGVINASGLVTLSGGLTIEDGDTFTFDGQGLTDVLTSGETFADNDASLMTSGAIVHQFLQYSVEGGADAGATIYIKADAPYADGDGAGVKGDIWIDT